MADLKVFGKTLVEDEDMPKLKILGKEITEPEMKILGKTGKEINEAMKGDGKLRVFGQTLEDMRQNRRKTGETFPSKFTKNTLSQSSIDNLQPSVASRVDFSDEKKGPNFKVAKKQTKKVETKEGERGSVDRTDEVKASGPDMGKVNKEESKPAREFTATEKAQNLMSPGYNKNKGGMIKKMSSGGKVGSASKRADGCAMRGKTKGRMI
jgi:hypothetical protein